jgi:hypothetical protein
MAQLDRHDRGDEPILREEVTAGSRYRIPSIEVTSWQSANRFRNSGKRRTLTNESRDIDALFQAPLVEFTASRNELAARLKKAGRREEADRVKGLAKPSVSAWVVNQLYWKHQHAFNELLLAGKRAPISSEQASGHDTVGPSDHANSAISTDRVRCGNNQIIAPDNAARRVTGAAINCNDGFSNITDNLMDFR